jgi:hypothetical protein
VYESEGYLARRHKSEEQVAAEQATGCSGAGDYRIWAQQQGYEHLEVVDWTSSAGDWSFIVSQDGETWFLMMQENAHPCRGFNRTIYRDQSWEGTAEEVLQQISEEMAAC